ncbi:uncharacterized protein LOC141934000 [Strix aluco]|uniref:uncharacterized protein LOC141934000 n=1 Tax=Strix aluco TaxID=111821 RepID=UPI003DA54671
MRRGRGAGLAGLAAVLLVAAGRAQVQQEPSAETNEGTGVTINCSHPNIQTGEFIHWYRQLPGRAPAFLAFILKGSKDLQAPPGRLSVAADRRSSALWLARPRRGDAAVYYCALGDTGRGAGAAAGHEPPRAGPDSSHRVRSSSSTSRGEADVDVTGTFRRSPQWISFETMSLFDRIQFFTGKSLRAPAVRLGTLCGSSSQHSSSKSMVRGFQGTE